jgi:hypothetical protein
MKTALRLLALSAAGLLLAACATRRLAPDFAQVADAYAENMNRQMLLNLARLDQGHPAYFMAIGEVRVARSQSASLQSSGNSSHNQNIATAASVTRSVTQALSGSLSGSGSDSVSPTFVFIPINSEEASRQLLSPIPVEVFATLYEQGWPVDQLLRVMVERIEVRFDDPARLPILLVNSPTRGEPEHFARFLRTCEVIRELQVRGGLRLASEEIFTPLADHTVVAEELDSGMVAAAADKGRTWQRRADGRYELGTRRTLVRFVAYQPVVDATMRGIRQAAASDPTWSAFDSGRGQTEIDNIEAVLLSQPEIRARREASDPDAAEAGIQTVLILRSFRNMLEAVAVEQRAFDELAQRTPFLRGVPEGQKRPVLRTDWSGHDVPLAGRLIEVRYADRDYAIADPAELSVTTMEARWNRDVFRLLINLSSQVTVDITKFQRQVLELSP